MPAPRPADVAVIRRSVEAFNRRDLAATVEVAHPEASLVPGPSNYLPPGTAYNGRTGAQTLLEQLFRADFRAQAEEFRVLRGRLLVNFSITEHPDGEKTGLLESTVLYRLVDGLVAGMEGFASEADAYEAAERPTGLEFRALFQEAPVPIVLLDSEHRFVEANAAACGLFGVRVEDIQKRTILEFVPADSVGRVEELFHASRARGQLIDEIDLVSVTGELHPAVELRATSENASGNQLAILVARKPSGAPGASGHRLTAREREIFRLLALGSNAPAIADGLGISPDTVRTHVRNGIVKLDAKTRLQAVTLALEQGEIEL